MEIVLRPIGLIHTPFDKAEGTPIQASRSEAEGWVEVFPEYTVGLQDIEAFSYLYLIYYLNRAEPAELLVEPFLDNRKHGVFSTRHPRRPNHLGISIVRLIARQENRLHVSRVDMFDKSPLLDIKPYIPDFDHVEAPRTGWYERRSKP